MARPKNLQPTYCKHRRKGRPDEAYTRIHGKWVSLGRYGSPESHEAFRRILAEFAIHGGRLPNREPDLVMVELIDAYLKYADSYYSDPREIGHIKRVTRVVRELYGATPTIEFGPLALEAVRHQFVSKKHSRRYINANIQRLKRIFKWAVAREMIPPSIYQALSTVEGLRRGRSAAVEHAPIRPVSEDVFTSTLSQLSRVVQDMALLQWWSGMRPGELINMRPCDIDTSGRIWIYRPANHKTANRGYDRTVFLGPEAQAIVKRYLTRETQAFCFSPREAVESRFIDQEAKRETPRAGGYRRESKRKTNGKRRPREQYSIFSYRRSIVRACKRAEVPEWTPHQLRHSAGTRFRKAFGLEISRALLGHRSIQPTQIYAEQDLTKCVEAISKVG